jgi:Lrp/AsnC family transcriptional regulator, regulator of ectoine-degradation genes
VILRASSTTGIRHRATAARAYSRHTKHPKREYRPMTRIKSQPNGVDRIDLNILAALFSRARISKVQMSAEVGVSASRCYERMKYLEQAGIIRGYHADIDIARLASCLQFFVQVKLLNYTAARCKRFEKTVLKIPEIVSCQSVLGHIDYIVVVVAASVEKYQDVITELRTSSENDFDFVTFPVSKTVKSEEQSDLRQIVTSLTRGVATSS